MFSMLVPVREIAAARFDLDPDAEAVRRAHADYYVRLAAEIEPLLGGSTQLAALARLEAERDTCARDPHLIAIGDVDPVGDAIWRLMLYWWIRNLLPEAKAWMQDILERACRWPTAPARSPSGSRRGSRCRSPVQRDRSRADRGGVALFCVAGDPLGEAATLAVLGIACTSASPPDLDRAAAFQQRALDLVPPTSPDVRCLFRGAMGAWSSSGDAPRALAIFDAVREDAVRLGDIFVEMFAHERRLGATRAG